MLSEQVGPPPNDRAGDRPLGLADRFDELLLRLEVWRERPGIFSGLIIVAAAIAGLGWWLGRPPSAEPVEALIPMADAAAAGNDRAQPIDGPALSGLGSGPAVGGPDGAGASERGSALPTGDSPADAGPDVAVGASGEVQLVVHVVGAVLRPGLVSLGPGSRIADAVAAAGGSSPGADVDRLNLAAPVADGMQVRVPEVGEEVAGGLVVAAEPVSGPSPSEPGGPVNLNTATDDQLQALPGIGPATAAAIIAWRTDHGGFLTVDDLTSVPGIGPVKLAALGDLVTI